MYLTNAFLITKILVLFILSFATAFLMAPVLIHFLYKYQCWKKKPRDRTIGGAATPIFTALHGAKEVNTPRMGGVLIWGSVLIITLALHWLALIFPESVFMKLDFLSRRQTWLPFFTLVAASVLGLVDDLLVIQNKGGYVGGGIRFQTRLALIFLIALIGAWWFYFKLEWTSMYIPFYGNIEIDGWYILLFIITMFATFSGSVVDGLDGLSAGVLAPIFAAFGVIAYSQGHYNLSSFIIVVIGALIAYLWFNVHPAKFYMGETGIMGLTVILAVIALLTNAVLFLPIIAFVLVLEAGSVILQLLSKKFRGKKIFLVAPLHHHFEALGWPETKVTMRFWIISALASGMGLVLYFLSKFM